MSNNMTDVRPDSPAIEALLDKRLRELAARNSAEVIIPQRRQEDFVPLSFAQQRLWFLDKLEPGSSAYNMPSAMRIKGALNVEAFRKAVDLLVVRHESLRTTFDTVDGHPRMVIAPTLEVALPIVDLTELPAAEREARVLHLAAEESHLPFDLSRGPLFRGSLLRLGDEEHVMLLTAHHIVSDGWSQALFFKEFSEIYEDLVRGNAGSLPELPIQYADFAVWQRQWLQGEVLEKQLNYWRERLRGAPALLKLPADHPRPAVRSGRGAHHRVAFPSERLKKLKELSRREGVTLYMTLLAAFKTLLFRHTDQEDMVVGSPIANRNHPEVEGVIGFFVNTLALRTDMSGDPTFRELLKQVKEVTLGAFDHQDTPFDKVVEDLQPQRSLSYSPVVQVSFGLNNTPPHKGGPSDLTLTPIQIESGTSKFDLSLELWEIPDGLKGILEYSTDLFEGPSIARLMQRFETLLDSIVADPEQRISRLSLLTEAERRQLLVEWNDTRAVDTPYEGVHQRFEAQVEHTPDATALIFGNQRITYRELNRRANQLANFLRTLGVGPEVLVAICVDRSVEMIVGILAILKSGGAYVPLDPAHPDERIEYILKDSGSNLLVVKKDLSERFEDLVEQLVVLDSGSELITREPADNLNLFCDPNNLAYVIYTSGSTGRPKGVMVTHKNVARLFKSTDCLFKFNETDVWTLFHSFAFDFSVWEIWGALAYGGRLVIVPYEVSRSPGDFYKLLCKEGVTVLNQTPSAFRALANCGEATNSTDQPEALRYVIFGGEALDFSILQPWIERRRGLATKLINMYGITETTVHVTFREISESDVGTANASLIGEPIPDLALYILDQHLEPVPVGVPGEMYVSGGGLARGYLNRPELTAERFIRNPFSPEPGSRMYKTGDFARSLEDGQIEFIGRIDDQVKIRGFRIELGEIEAVLAAHPDVCEVVVIAREDNTGNKNLAAYFTANGDINSEVSKVPTDVGQKLPAHMLPSASVQNGHIPSTSNRKFDRSVLSSPDRSFDKRQEQEFVTARSTPEKLVAEIRPKIEPAELRTYLRQKLPDYMIPSAFVQLERFALTPNGKIDRKSLPAPSDLGPESEKSSIQPRDEVEAQLADIWKSVLGISRIGVKDDFFDLGGHSLLAVRLFAEIENKFGRNIPLATLFHASTIEQLARSIRTERSGDKWTSLVPINANGSKPPLFLMHAAGGNVLFYRDLAARLGPDQPCYGMQAVGLSGHQSAYDRIEDMAAHYIREIRGVQPKGPYHLGGSSMGGLIAYEVGRQLRDSGEEVKLIALFDTFAPGYPVPIPGRSRIGLELLGHADRIQQHIDSLRLLEPDRRWPYFVAKATKARNAIRRSYIKTKRKLARGILTSLGRPLPEALVVTQNLIAVATRTYRPKPFDGDLVLFRATKQIRGTYRDDTLGWSNFAKGKLEIHEINGSHGTIVVEPRVRFVVPILQQILGESESAREQFGATES